MNYFEIFLNEVRKLEIASGEWEDPNNKVKTIFFIFKSKLSFFSQKGPKYSEIKLKKDKESIIEYY